MHANAISTSPVATKCRGFTLVETIIVIVVLAIVASGTTIYILRSIEAYTATARRDQLASLGRSAIERVTRELRNALPNSVRIQNNCIEFLPIIAGSVYLDLPVDSSASSFSAVPFTPPTAGTHYVVVYPYSAALVYAQGNPGPLSGFAGSSGTPVATVTLSATHRFARHSPTRRFYVVAGPVSFCVVGTALYRYAGYALAASQATPPAGGALLAQHVQLTDAGSVTPFRYDPGTLHRSGVIRLDMRFMRDNEWIRLSQEVQLRNAP